MLFVQSGAIDELSSDIPAVFDVFGPLQLECQVGSTLFGLVKWIELVD